MFKLGVGEYDAVLNIMDKYLQEMVQGFFFQELNGSLLILSR
jgi:hypothetical protein